MPKRSKPPESPGIARALMKDVERGLSALAKVPAPPGAFPRHTIESAAEGAQPLVRAALAEAKADRDARRRVLKALAKRASALPEEVEVDLARLLVGERK